MRRLLERLSPLALVAMAMVALGVAAGVAFDARPARPPAYRGAYRVLEADFHSHTTYSDGTLSPLTLVRQAERRGLDVLAVTEHNTTVAGRLARGWSEMTGGPLILVGEEVTTSAYHLIAAGIDHTVSPYRSLEAVVADIHAQGGVAIAAHPVRRFQPGLASVRSDLDGVEVMHPIAYRSGGSSWRWRDLVSYWETSTPRPAAIGSSDYHFASVLGLCRTLLFVREPVTAASVLDAVRDKRTVVTGKDGELFGDPALVELLRREPWAPRDVDYAYRGDGVADRVLRLVGLAGVAMLAFVRVRRPKARLVTAA